MVWPIDAPKGRFPSKIAHYRGEGRGTPIYPAAYPQPDTPTSHNSTTHANQVRSATSHCCVPTAASRQWALQPRRLLLTPLAAALPAFGCCALLTPPPDHCAPCVRSTFVNQGRGSTWELCSRRSNNTREEEVVGRKQRTAADRPTEARSPASGCSVGVLAVPFCTVKRRPLQNGVLGLCLCEARPQLQQPTTMSNSISLKSVQRTASGRLERQLQRSMPC